ncbi:MAG: flagellar basal body-associated FliL family protein [Planctomycetaceae bacterium]
MMKILVVAGVVGFVVISEVVLAYMLIPSTKQVQEWAETHDVSEEHSKEKDAHAKEGHDKEGHGDEKKADDGHGGEAKAKPAKGGHGEAKGGHGAAKPAAKAGGHGGGHGAPAAAAHGGGHGGGGHGGGHGAPAAGGHGPAVGPALGSGGTGEVEMDLGKYNIMVYHPAQNMTLKINFHLIGTVTEGEETDASTLFTHVEHRLRDQIIFEIRNSTPADLTDPGLGLIKRKILAKTNELLGQPLLQNIVFSDFTYLEQ